HREAEDVEDIDTKEICPGGIAEGETVFLNSKKQAEPKDFRAAKNSLFGSGAVVSFLLAQSLGNKRERNACKKNEKRGRKCAAKLRPDEHGRLARFWAEPRVVAVRLEHEDAGEAAHPVDVGETFHFVELRRRLSSASVWIFDLLCLERKKSKLPHYRRLSREFMSDRYTIQYALACYAPNRADVHARTLGSSVRGDDSVCVLWWICLFRAGVCRGVCGVCASIWRSVVVCGARRAGASRYGGPGSQLAALGRGFLRVRDVLGRDGNDCVSASGRSCGVFVCAAGCIGERRRSGIRDMAGFFRGRGNLGCGKVWSFANNLAIPRRKAFLHFDDFDGG